MPRKLLLLLRSQASFNRWLMEHVREIVFTAQYYTK